MTHEVSETDVESRREGEVEPTPLRPPPEGAAAASTTGRVDATDAEARELAEAARETTGAARASRRSSTSVGSTSG